MYCYLGREQDVYAGQLKVDVEAINAFARLKWKLGRQRPLQERNRINSIAPIFEPEYKVKTTKC